MENLIYFKDSKDTPLVVRAAIDALLQLKKENGKPMYTQQKIATMRGVSVDVVRHVKKNGVETKRRKVPENHRKTSKRTDRLIVSLTLKNRQKSAAFLLRILKSYYNVNICKNTLRSRLKEAGIRYCRKTKKFLLNAKMMAKRLKWARMMKTSMAEEDWDNVAWSDESMIKWNLYYNTHVYRKKCEKYHPECVDNAVKHPKQIMIWGVINSRGIGKFKKRFKMTRK